MPLAKKSGEESSSVPYFNVGDERFLLRELVARRKEATVTRWDSDRRLKNSRYRTAGSAHTRTSLKT